MLLGSQHKKAQSVSLQYERMTAHVHCAFTEHFPVLHSAPCAFTEHCISQTVHMCTALLLNTNFSQTAHVHCTIAGLSCRPERLTSSLSNVFDTKQVLRVPSFPATELEVTLVLCVPHFTCLYSYCSIM